VAARTRAHAVGDRPAQAQMTAVGPDAPDLAGAALPWASASPSLDTQMRSPPLTTSRGRGRDSQRASSRRPCGRADHHVLRAVGHVEVAGGSSATPSGCFSSGASPRAGVPPARSSARPSTMR
jgi:hypothetical protein